MSPSRSLSVLCDFLLARWREGLYVSCAYTHFVTLVQSLCFSELKDLHTAKTVALPPSSRGYQGCDALGHRELTRWAAPRRLASLHLSGHSPVL